MVYEQRHMELGGQKVISHFTFTPPLIASSNLDGQGCFIFPINTEGEVYRQDGKTSVKADQGVLLKCGTYVNKWKNVDEKKPSEVVILRLFPEVIKENLDQKTLESLKKRMNHHKTTALVQLDVLMKKYLEGLFFYFDNPSLVSEDIVNLKLTELLMLLVSFDNVNGVTDLLSSLFEDTAFNFRQVVEANIFENLSIEELSVLCNMSPSTFRRKFKELMGNSPGQYIKNKRLKVGADLLKNTNKSISEIGYQIGFSDPNYFSKSFHAKFSQSPSEYRKTVDCF